MSWDDDFVSTGMKTRLGLQDSSPIDYIDAGKFQERKAEYLKLVNDAGFYDPTSKTYFSSRVEGDRVKINVGYEITLNDNEIIALVNLLIMVKTGQQNKDPVIRAYQSGIPGTYLAHIIDVQADNFNPGNYNFVLGKVSFNTTDHAQTKQRRKDDKDFFEKRTFIKNLYGDTLAPTQVSSSFATFCSGGRHDGIFIRDLKENLLSLIDKAKIDFTQNTCVYVAQVKDSYGKSIPMRLIFWYNGKGFDLLTAYIRDVTMSQSTGATGTTAVDLGLGVAKIL